MQNFTTLDKYSVHLCEWELFTMKLRQLNSTFSLYHNQIVTQSKTLYILHHEDKSKHHWTTYLIVMAKFKPHKDESHHVRFTITVYRHD